MRHLAEAWIKTAGQVEARGDVAGAGVAVLVRYAEPHRRYHDLAHLDQVLRRVDELAAHASDIDAVRLAAWFHDAVYDIGAEDNEQRSADLARTVLRELRVGDAVVAEVERLVRLTATHDPSDSDADGAVLCDADLAILAADPAGYSSYAEAVREEYADVVDPAFASGRAKVLRSLLDRPSLYRTSYAHARWEESARANVAAELERLRASTEG